MTQVMDLEKHADLMSSCYACGKSITEHEAHAQYEVGGVAYLLCCPMCSTAIEAGSVQRRMVPASFSNERATIFVEYLPALMVGGDFACLRWLGDDKLHLSVGDVSGHGVTSSIIMSRLSAELQQRAEAEEDLVVMTAAMNKRMKFLAGSETLYTTLFSSVIDFTDQSVTYVNCGHPAPLLCTEGDQGVRRLVSQNIPIGLFGPYEFGIPRKSVIRFRPGDRLMLFTDGLLELKREDGSEIGEKGIFQIFQEVIRAPSETAERNAFEQLKALREGQNADDLLFIFVDIKGGLSA